MDPDGADGSGGSGRAEWPWALLIASVVLAALVATDRDYAMIWDEGYSVRREQALADWFASVADGPAGRARAFSAAGLARGWPFGREEPDGHPSFYALLGLAGWAVSHRWVAPPLSYRLGAMTLAAFTVGAVYLHLARRRGRLAAITAAGSIALLPQAFSLAHYAHYDMPLSCLWVLAQMAFVRASRSRLWIAPFGLALGLTIGSKFTGVFAVVPALAWVAWTEWIARIPLYPGAIPSAKASPGWGGTRTLVAGVAIAALTLYAIQPPWWFDPIGGPRRFVASNLTRSATIPIPSLYLGAFYRFGLPWHNTLVYTAVCLPVGVLALGLIGIGSVVSGRVRDGGEGWIWVLSWGTLMVVRALPNAPGHDGIRLIFPSILSLAVLAGLGAANLRDRLSSSRWSRVPALLSALALGGCGLGIIQLYPYTLSFYSEAIGGLKGAESIGFDRTYYWDTMGRELFDWAARERKRRPVALRFPSYHVNLTYLREWGRLPPDVPIFNQEVGAKDARGDYVAQMRPAMFYPYDWWLERNGHPIFTIRRQGVDLLRVYSPEESVRAAVETVNIPLPSYLAP